MSANRTARAIAIMTATEAMAFPTSAMTAADMAITGTPATAISYSTIKFAATICATAKLSGLQIKFYSRESKIGPARVGATLLCPPEAAIGSQWCLLSPQPALIRDQTSAFDASGCMIFLSNRLCFVIVENRMATPTINTKADNS